MIHPTADVKTPHIGTGTSVWQFAVILGGAVVGDNCNINCHTFIENDVKIGNNVTVKAGVYLWDGISVEDDVFIGPNVTFTNDRYPRSKVYPSSFQRTLIRKGASLGANATILGGLTVGAYALVGAGSVVTKDVPANAIVYGNPAKITGWIDKDGRKLQRNGDEWINAAGETFTISNNELVQK